MRIYGTSSLLLSRKPWKIAFALNDAESDQIQKERRGDNNDDLPNDLAPSRRATADPDQCRNPESTLLVLFFPWAREDLLGDIVETGLTDYVEKPDRSIDEVSVETLLI